VKATGAERTQGGGGGINEVAFDRTAFALKLGRAYPLGKTTAMQHWLRSDLRKMVCIAAAMLYALSVFAPHFTHAYALAPESFVVSEHHHGVAATQQHVDEHLHTNAEHPAPHSKHGHNDANPKCCVQLNLTVLPPQSIDPAFVGLSHSQNFTSLVTKLTGRSPGRLDRPPNT
jgi:hypothetical protein